MRRTIMIVILMCGVLTGLTACGSYAIPPEGTLWPQETQDDPFEAMEEETVYSAAIGHGPLKPNRDDEQRKLPFEYDGGEFSLEYYLNTEGNLKSVGFLLFLDGKPQPYKTNDSPAYEYCHSFPAEDGGKLEFTLSFIPCSGRAGDTLSLTAVSITNPDFQPDMRQATSYGWYHQILSNYMELHFNTDGLEESQSNSGLPDVFSDVSVKEEKVTANYIEDLPRHGWNGVSLDTLDDGIYYTFSYNGDIVYDNICVSEKDELSMRSTFCGTPGVEYTVTYFINHQPVCSEGLSSYNLLLEKGNVWTLDAMLDTDKLPDFSTFYVMAIPSDNTALAIKSNSILLYKEIDEK